MFGAEVVLVAPSLKGLSIGVNDIRRNQKKILLEETSYKLSPVEKMGYKKR